MYNLQDAVESAQAELKKTPAEKRAYVAKLNQNILQFAGDVKKASAMRLKAKDMEQKINASNRSDFEKAHLIANYEAKHLELLTKIINREQTAGIAV